MNNHVPLTAHAQCSNTKSCFLNSLPCSNSSSPVVGAAATLAPLLAGGICDLYCNQPPGSNRGPLAESLRRWYRSIRIVYLWLDPCKPQHDGLVFTSSGLWLAGRFFWFWRHYVGEIKSWCENRPIAETHETRKFNLLVTNLMSVIACVVWITGGG